MLKIAIHQPQYIPWPAYFDKILKSDIFILLDDVQFQKNGLQNRNQIKTPQGKAWLTLPVKHSFGQLIKDVEIDNVKSKIKNMRSLQMSYSQASYFATIYELISGVLTNHSNLLSEIAVDIIKAILSYLDYKGEILLSSKFSIKSKASHLVLDLCKQVGADQYLSGSGGRGYLVREDFEQAGVEIKFQQFNLPPYKQCFPKLGFIPDLSILDLLFNEGEAARKILEAGGAEPYLSWDEVG